MCGIHKYVARRPHVKHLVVFLTTILCCNAFAGFMSCHLQLNGITDRIVSFTFSAAQASNNQTIAQVIPSYTEYINAPLKQHPMYADTHTRLFMPRSRPRPVSFLAKKICRLETPQRTSSFEFLGSILGFKVAS